MSERPTHWLTYEGKSRNRAPRICSYDAALEHPALRQGLPWCTTVVIDLAGDGTELPSSEEATPVYEFEERVLRAAANRCGMVLVYTQWDGRQRAFITHSDQRGTVLSCALEMAAHATALRVDGYERKDPGWKTFLRDCVPTPCIKQHALNRPIIEELRKVGDALDRPRTVDHFAYFTTRAGLDRFVAAARALGCTPTGITSDGQPPWKFGVHLTAHHSIDPQTLDVSCELAELAAKHKGQYDGWGSPTGDDLKA